MDREEVEERKSMLLNYGVGELSYYGVNKSCQNLDANLV